MTAPAPTSPVRLLDSARSALVEEHRPLAVAIVRSHRGLLCTAYSFEDACQDAWLALVAAADGFDPARGPFGPFARIVVTRDLYAGRRRALGRPRRGSFRYPSSLDALDDHGHPLVEAISDPDPGPDEGAEARVALTAAVAAGRAACRDRYDTVVLAWMLDLHDLRTQRQLAADFGIHSQRIHTRHRRLVRLMARAAGAAA